MTRTPEPTRPSHTNGSTSGVVGSSPKSHGPAGSSGPISPSATNAGSSGHSPESSTATRTPVPAGAAPSVVVASVAVGSVAGSVAVGSAAGSVADGSVAVWVLPWWPPAGWCTTSRWTAMTPGIGTSSFTWLAARRTATPP